MRAVRFNLDAVGLCASTLCMLHCLAFPLVLAVLPMWKLAAGETEARSELPLTLQDAGSSVATSLTRHESEHDCCVVASTDGGESSGHASCCSTPTDFWFHVGLLAAVAPLGLVAWGAGYRKHRRIGVLCLGAAGVLLVSGALLFGHQLFAGRGEQIMTVAGSVCMVTAHLWNRRQCRCCRTTDLTRLVEIETPRTLVAGETA